MDKLLELKREDMQGNFPKDLIVPAGYVIAGGSVRRWFLGEKQDSDFDYFLIGQERKEMITNEYKFIYENKVTKTYEYKKKTIQVIIKEYETIHNLLSSFDFHHCQFAYDGKKIYASQYGIISSMRKHLSFNNFIPGFQLDTLRRAFKYQRQGYTPCIGTMQKLAMMCSELTEEKIKEMIELSPSGGKRSIIRYD